ncbi:DUF3422 family protein [Cupriavidus basilensis]
MPTIAEFMERRFAPAMGNVQGGLGAPREQFAGRVARAVDLLRTRVNLAQEQDTTRLLEGMDQDGPQPAGTSARRSRAYPLRPSRITCCP